MLVRPSSAGFVNPPEGNVISASPKVESVCAAKRPFVRDLFFCYSHSDIEEKKQKLSLVALGKGWVVRVHIPYQALPHLQTQKRQESASRFQALLGRWREPTKNRWEGWEVAGHGVRSKLE